VRTVDRADVRCRRRLGFTGSRRLGGRRRGSDLDRLLERRGSLGRRGHDGHRRACVRPLASRGHPVDACRADGARSSPKHSAPTGTARPS
jgi:hypothetical protein